MSLGPIPDILFRSKIEAAMTVESISRSPSFLDLFAGAGGMSEGFIRAGFSPVAHVESNKAACFTLRTRVAYHWLRSRGDLAHYRNYLTGDITRSALYELIPRQQIASVINAEIGSITLKRIFEAIDSQLNGRDLDVIIGGPPCQAYSIVGRSRDSSRMQGDERNYLYIYYAKFLERYKPAYFLFENVMGLLSAKDQDGNLYFERMRDLFRLVGYDTQLLTLSAEDYGVPQKRMRIILFGKKGDLGGLSLDPAKWKPKVHVSDVLSDMPHLNAGQGNPGPCEIGPDYGSWLREAGIRNEAIPVTWHQARPNTEQDLEIYRMVVELWNKERRRLDYDSLPDHLKTHRNRDSFRDRFKVVASDLPYSHTVVAHIAKDGHYYIHPDIRQNRSLTPREAARLQTFPDDYYFESYSDVPMRTPVYRQIGNAVPVLLAERIAKKLQEVF